MDASLSLLHPTDDCSPVGGSAGKAAREREGRRILACIGEIGRSVGRSRSVNAEVAVAVRSHVPMRGGVPSTSMPRIQKGEGERDESIGNGPGLADIQRAHRQAGMWA